MKALRNIWDLVTPADRKSALVLVCLMFVAMVLETLGVGIVIPALALLSQRDIASKYPALQPALHALGNPSQQHLVIGGMLVLVGVYFVKTLFMALLAWWQTRFTFGVQEQLSQRLFTVYLRQPYTFHLQRNSAQLIQNIINEVSQFTSGALTPGISIFNESLVLLGLSTLLLAVEPLGAMIVVAVLGTTAWVFHRFTRTHIARWGEARLHHDGLRIQQLQQGLGGAKDVKLLGRETDFLERYRTHNVQSMRFGRLNATLQQLPRLWLELLAVCGLAIVVISMLVQGRSIDAVLPTLGLFAAAAFRLMPSAGRILNAGQSLRYALPVIDTLHAEFKLASLATTRTRSTITPFYGSVKLSNVGYSYPGAPVAALSGISLSVCRGETVGIIGTSGAGKSTLVDILLGLLTPDSGEVQVDGKDIQHDLRNWQDQIGYVPQSIFLTDDTLVRNVAFGLPNDQINEVAVWRAIRAAQLEEFVNSLPQGLATLVGERGVRLSGGQRQRIGIARSLYHDPAVLVLDEATSSLDITTERSVMQAVRLLQGTKTIFIVAHRLSTVEDCGRLYRLEKGRVVEEGTPKTMLLKTARA
jgi:ABC-type multidrug transport system fused ATPase/permease subunit